MASKNILELHIDYFQTGLLFLKPTFEQVKELSKATNTSSLIDHLRVSLSRTLDFFSPFCGRLDTTKDEQNGTISFFINCNNAGAQLNHATAHGIRVSDIVESDYNPYVVRDFFPLNGVQNKEATSQPCFAVRNSWTEISRGLNVISKIPFLKRQFPFKINHFSDRISIPNERINAGYRFIPPTMLRERVFHFSKESVAKLKAKANHEMNTTKISSLQAVLAHVWRSVIRCRRLDLSQETTFEVSIDMRERLNPPLPEGFFGNAICPGTVTITTGELLEHEFGWAALQINEMIASHDHEKLKCIYENWMNDPEYDFGWGNPITDRSGIGNMFEGKITASPGLQEGSMILEICLSSETIEALEKDKIFGEFVTTPVGSLERTVRARI
ncbi:hypothetical protein BC332_32853 [Capsicum chinense]|nr:hypothetical protein BC332_32853 [Capsicum chinense]